MQCINLLQSAADGGILHRLAAGGGGGGGGRGRVPGGALPHPVQPATGQPGVPSVSGLAGEGRDIPVPRRPPHVRELPCPPPHLSSLPRPPHPPAHQEQSHGASGRPPLASIPQLTEEPTRFSLINDQVYIYVKDLVTS